LTTDDWPYLYLERPRIPGLHLCLTAILLLLFAAGRRIMLKGMRIDRHFFFLGAAFLLLEFQNISKTALLFGSTWLVSAFTISAILLLILGANMIAARWRPAPALLYAGLLASALVVYVIPLDVLNALPFGGRVLAAGMLLNLPILFAGVIFITSFQRASSASDAFGSNLLGAALGGLLESVSFITGIKMLLIFVIGLYLASWVSMGKTHSS